MQNILNYKPNKIEMKKSIFTMLTLMIALIGHTKNNQLAIENNQLKEKINTLENPPINLSGKYKVEIGRFGFDLEIFDYKDSGFSFKYESFCKKGGESYSSFGEGQAIKKTGNKFTTKGNILDDASEDNFQIEFVMTKTGIDVKFICGINDAFCWRNNESLSLVKGE